MKAPQDLIDIKRRISATVLKIQGVSGVGLPADGLTVYLENESSELRQRVMRALEPLGLEVPIHWQITGALRPQ